LATINKTGRPKILTESDQVLNDLKAELISLKSRMSTIEEEQEQNRVLVEKLSFQENLANEALLGHQEEVSVNRENYQVIAGVMNNLKSPVSNVVSNLSGVIAEIDDSETRNTLQDCMQTASNVLNAFDEVEDFCMNVSRDDFPAQKAVDTRKFFRDVISIYQADINQDAMTFRLLVDKQVPERSALHCDTIKACLNGIVQELQNSASPAKITIRISSEKKEQKYGIEIEDLSVTVETDPTLSIDWKESWLESIKLNQEKLLNSGFNLLETRDRIRKAGGHMEILKGKNGVFGFKLYTPLTY
jgi:hypothetical protein